MAKKVKRVRSRLLRRYSVSLVGFMLLLILMLCQAAVTTIKEAVLNYSTDIVFAAASSVANESYFAVQEFDETGTIDEETMDSTLSELYDLQSQWGLENCYIAIPEEDGLRMLFGVGQRILWLHLEYDIEPSLMDFKTPYPQKMQAWLQELLRTENRENWKILEFIDEQNGHMAYAAIPIYGNDNKLLGVAIVEDSLANAYKLLIEAAVCISLLIVLVTAIILIVFYHRTKKQVVLPIQILNREALDIRDRLKAGEVYQSNIHTGDEIEELSRSFEQMSCDLRDYISENSRISAERERIATELDMAASIQANQLPNVFPPFPDRTEFDLFASMKPAKEVGGDFYDFFLVDDDHLALVIADVSGKGVPAALLMMTSRTLIKENLSAGLSPAQALARVNVRLLETGRIRQFVTVWLAVVELSTGRGLAANAGHEHPVLKPAGGSYELVTYKHSPPVAATRKTTYRDREFTLMPGDTLFVYTDGVAEAANADEVLFGTDRLLEALNRAPDAAPEAAIENVNEALRGFVGDAEQSDDITMLCLRYCGAGEKPSFPE